MVLRRAGRLHALKVRGHQVPIAGRRASRTRRTCAGANLRYLPKGTRLIAIEPNRHFHSVLRRRASERGIELDLRGLAGEALDLPDESVDFFFSSLVLCSVTDPRAVAGEVLRVLKPGGRFASPKRASAGLRCFGLPPTSFGRGRR